MTARLEALARRVAQNPGFLAFSLADYARSEGIDDPELAARLNCDVRKLSKLRLCRRPRSAPELFQADVMRIASAFDIDLDALIEAVRRADALVALRNASDEAGFLMAARDQDHAKSQPSNDEEAS